MKILFATGGTAGHINPALAVAGYLRETVPNVRILFVGTGDRMESKLVPAAGFDFKTIDITGFHRSLKPKDLLFNLKTVQKMLTSSKAARSILKEFAPDAAVGFGGYVSGPVIRQAVKLGMKTAIHEQNAFPGVANKALAKTVDAVMLTVEDAGKYLECKNPYIVTGLPVRGEITRANRELARMELGLDNRPMILSTGGSLGARAINEAMTEVIVKHHKQAPYYHMHAMGQYGLWMRDLLKEKGVDLKREKNLMIREYIDDMDRCYAAADLVIGRAGASSISELQALGKPSILIPSPNVAENHQYHNAMALVSRGAAKMIEEKDLTGERLSAMVEELLGNPSLLQEIGKNAKAMAKNDAKEKIAETIVNLAKKA